MSEQRGWERNAFTDQSGVAQAQTEESAKNFLQSFGEPMVIMTNRILKENVTAVLTLFSKGLYKTEYTVYYK